MPTYVRVSLRVATNKGSKVVTLWAEKLGRCHYRRVNRFGDWGARGVDERFVVSAPDVVSEQPAEISKKYAELEVV